VIDFTSVLAIWLFVLACKLLATAPSEVSSLNSCFNPFETNRNPQSGI